MRKEQKKLVESRAVRVDLNAIAAAAKRRDAWWASTTATASEEWRSGRHRDRKCWVVGDTSSIEGVDMGADSVGTGDIPGGSSNGARETLSTQPTQEGTSQATMDTEWENEHVTDIT